MKRRATAIEVELEAGRPVLITREGRRVRVARVIDSWVVRGRWWAREERRVYFRLETPRGVMDVYERGGRWYLSRVLD